MIEHVKPPAPIDLESDRPLIEAAKRWPFVESPGEFSERLAAALTEFGDVLGAVRQVLIENPPVLFSSAKWAVDLADPAEAGHPSACPLPRAHIGPCAQPPKTRAVVHLVHGVHAYDGNRTMAAFESRADAEAFMAKCIAHDAKKPKRPAFNVAEAIHHEWWLAYQQWAKQHPAGCDRCCDSYVVETLAVANPTPLPGSTQ